MTTDAVLGQVSLESLPFGRIPSWMKVRAFGVDYAHVRTAGGGDLFVTKHGWSRLAHIQPENWYENRWFACHGERLSGASGSVYRVITKPVGGASADLVVKFSRMAQEVSILVATTFPEGVPPETMADARFNSPMEEFGLVMELRRGASGERVPAVLTQRPMAIFVPPGEFALWELGRSHGRFHTHSSLLAEDQQDTAKAIELDIRRMYVLLYGWIKGVDAEDSYRDGVIGEAEFLGLAPRVSEELARRGFQVLDNKPKHFILRRRRRDGRAMRDKSGRLVYGLVDFELLQRTPEHQKKFKIKQRERYWGLKAGAPALVPVDVPGHMKQATIFGVSYLFGDVPDGGRIWVVGRDPELFDYFLPERWRRTPRVKLSPTNEVYRTRTRDNVHIVYRRSRVGTRPRTDPLSERARRIRAHGYNSPFEEVALAERLRCMGISTTCPRAICRTAHPTTTADHLRDDRRFLDHAHLIAPANPPEPVLSRAHDYYTIWDSFTGPDPGRDPSGRVSWRVIDLSTACRDGILGVGEHEELVRSTTERLRAAGFAGLMADDQMNIHCRSDGTLRRDGKGRVVVRVCMDALAAHDYGLLTERSYRKIVERLDARLRAADCELIDLSGQHLLLTADPDGQFDTDHRGEIYATLCSFDLIRGLYRPIR